MSSTHTDTTSTLTANGNPAGMTSSLTIKSTLGPGAGSGIAFTT
jgi:hypothetical protein